MESGSWDVFHNSLQSCLSLIFSCFILSLVSINTLFKNTWPEPSWLFGDVSFIVGDFREWLIRLPSNPSRLSTGFNTTGTLVPDRCNRQMRAVPWATKTGELCTRVLPNRVLERSIWVYFTERYGEFAYFCSSKHIFLIIDVWKL